MLLGMASEAPAHSRAESPRGARAIGPLLFFATIAVFARCFGAEFLLYDDLGYVLTNEHVKAGLTLPSLAWAFTSFDMGNWNPLTWLSHQLDVTLFGLDPTGHHATSVLLHAANAWLLHAVLTRATKRPFASAVAAALFAFHPQRTESVAWVAERKDVLSMTFALLAIGAHLRGAGFAVLPRRLRVERAVWFVLALMAKPMVVTLPALLVLLDDWPLGRLRSTAGRFDARALVASLREKSELFALAAGIAVVTVAAQVDNDYVQSIALADRVANALVSWVRYLGHFLWPVELAVVYPHPNLPGGTPWTAGQVAAAAATLGAASALAWRAGGAFTTGWFWFVGALVPVIGLVQVGQQALADRYSYLPSIGLSLLVVFGAGDALARVNARVRPALAIAGALVLATSAARTVYETGHWHDTVSLFERAVVVSPASFIAHNTLGTALATRRAPGDIERALQHYEEALRIHPEWDMAARNAARARAELGRQAP